MSFFNPFHELYETKTYPNARSLRTTFSQKMHDTFWVFAGEHNLFDIESNFTKEHLGIYDYLTLGIPFLLAKIPFSLINEVDNIAAKIAITIAASIINIPRMVFSSILTIISLPFIAAAHGTTSLLASKHKYRASEFILSDDITHTTNKSFKDMLNVRGLTINSSTFSIQTTLENQKHQLHVSSKEPSIQLFTITETESNKQTFNQFFKSLCKLNIGNIQKNIEAQKTMPTRSSI